MYSRMRNTVFGLSAALTFAAATALLGQPVPQGSQAAAATPGDDLASPVLVPAEASPKRDRQSVRVNLAMPYYSFGRLLPRRES